MGPLTDRQMETFRKDFQEKEREIQRYIGVYLSGLVLVMGWILGPQSKPLKEMALGNDGYNVYALLIIAVVNALFISFLIYKSLTVHEITQFMASSSPSDSLFLKWEGWRRSERSATKPVRTAYFVLLALLPALMSAALIVNTARLIYTDNATLNGLLVEIESSSRAGAERTQPDQPLSAPTAPTPNENKQSPRLGRVSSVLWWAQFSWWFVLLLHIIPIWFFYLNTRPNKKRWDEIHEEKGGDGSRERLTLPPTAEQPTPSGARLFIKDTGDHITTVNRSQLSFLHAHLVKEHSADTAYYITQDTLVELQDKGADPDLIRVLGEAISRYEDGVEIQWSAD